MSIINDRRIGRFRIGVEMINAYPDGCRAIFSKVIILDAMLVVHNDELEYIAICEAFAPINEGEQVPLYIPTLKSHYDDAGNVASIELVEWRGGRA